MKAIWTGAIAFGLVNIPVKLYPAVNRRPVNFKMLHEKDNSPIEYKRWCAKHDHEVPWEEVVKGVDLGDGTFYVFSKRELQSLKPARSDVIDVVEFVQAAEVPIISIDQHYYIGPDRSGSKAFFLLQETLKRTKTRAVGTFVMRDREYVCTIEPYGPALLLSTLNFEDEIRSVEGIEGIREAPALKPKELELAEQLIEKMVKEHLDLSGFKDNYLARLKQALEERDQKHLVTMEAEVKPTADENLLDALKASLEGSSA